MKNVWISVKEKLPECKLHNGRPKDVRVLIVYEGVTREGTFNSWPVDHQMRKTYMERMHDFRMLYVNGDIYPGVTYWMPMPAPPNAPPTDQPAPKEM